MTDEIEKNPKTPKFKVGDRVRNIKYRNIFSKGYTEGYSGEVLIIDDVLKTNPWIHEIKDLNGEKITGSYVKELMMSKL